MGMIAFANEYFRKLNDPGQSTEQRVFALLEAVCKPLSFLTLAGIPFLGIAHWNNYELPCWLISYVFPILLSAAIGYLTNWIAIEMLFRPYEKSLYHPFALLTFGYWKQGLIPKNKEAIAEKVATTAEQQLLRPQALAADLCEMVGNILENKTLLEQIRRMLQANVIENSQAIADFLVPKIEELALTEMNKMLTPDSIRAFWDSQIEPLLTKEENKERMAVTVADFISNNSSDLASEIRPTLTRILQDYCQGKGGKVLGKIFFKMADHMTAEIFSRETIEDGIKNWIGKPETMALLKNKMTLMVANLGEYAKSSCPDDVTGDFVNSICKEFKDYIHGALNDRLQPIIVQIAQDEELWSALVNSIPGCKNEIRQFISTYGMPAIVENLNIGGRIQETISKQDMSAFHAMINELSSQHLCAIQVLGFLLGGLAGGLFSLIS